MKPGLFSLIVLTLALALACSGPGNEPPTPDSDSGPAGSGDTVARLFTVGDIDPEDPVKKIERFKPLADFLAGEMADLGFSGGRVVIARDIDEMAVLMRDDEVDLYLDSAFPTLAIRDRAESRVILIRWKDGEASYSSTFIVLRDSGIDSLDDLVGRVVAFEGPHSTSGFVLPAGTLADVGYDIVELSTPNATLSGDSVGYIFSQDEQNTVDLLLRGIVAAGGVSLSDYEELPPELKESITTIGETIMVPRQLASVRPKMDAETVDRITELLLGLDETEDGRTLLAGMKDTRQFTVLGDEFGQAVSEVSRLIRLVESAGE